MSVGRRELIIKAGDRGTLYRYDCMAEGHRGLKRGVALDSVLNSLWAEIGRHQKPVCGCIREPKWHLAEAGAYLMGLW